jgi:Uncharacterized conserved protein
MKSERQKVLDYLSEMNINCNVVEHPAVYTMEEMDNLHIDPHNQVVKNLFVRDDKKKRYFLLTVQKDKRVDLKELRAKLGSRPLSFASESALQEILGLDKGAVTPFGVLNDTNCRVEVVLDSEIRHFHRVGIHPNDNTATVWIAPKDLETVIKKHGNMFFYLDIEK